MQTLSRDLGTANILQLPFRRAVGKFKDQRLTCFVDALNEWENIEDQERGMVCSLEELGECAATEER